MSDSQVKQELARIRQSTAVATRRWLARHPGRPYRWAVLAGSGAFTDYTHIDLSAGLFASYIISHDPDTDWEVAKQTGKFLQELWFYEQNGALKDVAAYASDMLETGETRRCFCLASKGKLVTLGYAFAGLTPIRDVHEALHLTGQSGSYGSLFLLPPLTESAAADRGSGSD